jgi:cytochrome c5
VAEIDYKFFKSFTKLIVALMIVSFGIMYVSTQFSGMAKPTGNPQPLEPLEARIAPVSRSYVGAQGEEAAAAISAEIDQSNAALAAAAPVAEASTASIDETAPAEPAAAAMDIDGGEIYNSVCFVCHLAGVAGAPKLEAAAWEARVAKGADQLVQNAIIGFQGDTGMMPPKGGRMDLSDAQIQATVQWMLDNLE